MVSHHVNNGSSNKENAFSARINGKIKIQKIAKHMLKLWSSNHIQVCFFLKYTFDIKSVDVTWILWPKSNCQIGLPEINSGLNIFSPKVQCLQLYWHISAESRDLWFFRMSAMCKCHLAPDPKAKKKNEKKNFHVVILDHQHFIRHPWCNSVDSIQLLPGPRGHYKAG